MKQKKKKKTGGKPRKNQETPRKQLIADRLSDKRKIFWNYAILSDETGIPVSTLQKYVHRKLLKPLKLGRRVWFYPEDAVRRLIELGGLHV